MRTRHLLLAFFAYLILDLGSPFVLGAFSFDPDDSVDATSRLRERPSDGARVVAAPAVPAAVRPLRMPVPHTAEVPMPPVHLGWRPHAGDAASLAPRPAVDDD